MRVGARFPAQAIIPLSTACLQHGVSAYMACVGWYRGEGMAGEMTGWKGQRRGQ